MRTIRLTSIREASWLPVIAVAMSFTFVAGQIFNCCRINESLSRGIAHVLKTLSHPKGHHTAGKVASSHPGCHGHGESAESKIPTSPDYGSGLHLESDETCLSEESVTPKALQSNPIEFSGLFQESPFLLLISHITIPPRFEQPKPQNKSSPPLYLLTLRILV